MKEVFDFYSKTSLKSYNLNESMRYQLGRLDTLDIYTRQHSENVANLTCRLCEYLHLNTKFTVYCTICAYLHDIGKLFIPREILQKKEPLSADELDIMNTHTTIGHQMCINDPKLRDYANGPLFHHENLDGTGYPKGLTIDDIPMEGQIIRVADEYDILVHQNKCDSHIGISNILDNIIDKCRTNHSSYGKLNKHIVKALLQLVNDDIAYEITCVQEYVDFLKIELKRLAEIKHYQEKCDNTKNEEKKAYWIEGMRVLFSQGETFQNYLSIFEEYNKTYHIRCEKIEQLYLEMTKVKKLKV